MISTALNGLTRHQQFIIYRRELKPDGKMAKIPVNYQSGRNASAHDSANWLSYDQACENANRLGDQHGVGFVITPESKVFCLDIDGCLQPDRSWSPLALDIRDKLPGAACEVSVSGKGLHVWGRYEGGMPRHACKNGECGIELYTEGRFIALGRQDSANGNVDTDCTERLNAVIAEYFPQGGGDDELISRAKASRSANSVFDGKATFSDLWEANEAALGKCYPDTGTQGRAYDASSADAALAQHLAYWCGGDEERIERIMRRSALRRDKWDKHPTYLRTTIAKACARQGAIRIGDGSDDIPKAGTIELADMLSRFVFIQDGQQVVDLKRPQQVMALADWKAWLMASRTTVPIENQFNSDGTQKTKLYQTTTLWEQDPSRRVARTVTFRAGDKRLIRDPHGREAVNTWTPPCRCATPGDIALFHEHMEYLWGDACPAFLDWLAHIEQHPGELPQFGWLHISDRQGTGRNWLAGLCARLWPGYVAANFNLPTFFRTGFNDRLSHRLMAIVDEINEGANDSKWSNSETMKSLLNEEHRTINPKFGRIREEYNACRWLIFSNHRSALAMTETDRRFNVKIKEGPHKPAEYYTRLYGALKDPAFIAGVAQFLKARALTNFNPGAHAVMNADKESVINAFRSEADEILIHVVNLWPADVIPSSVLGELLGGTITPAYRHAFERRGIRSRAGKIKVNGLPTRVSILRNHGQWEKADPYLIAAEINRAPYQHGARALLDSLTVA